MLPSEIICGELTLTGEAQPLTPHNQPIYSSMLLRAPSTNSHPVYILGSNGGEWELHVDRLDHVRVRGTLGDKLKFVGS